MTSVVSADGTRLAYERSGSGPPVILVDGALCSRVMGPMASVAKLLEPDFTVIRYDRRGRNESGNTLPYAIDRELDDLEALAREVGGTPFVFGMSSGAVLALKAAARGLAFRKVALYEPPVGPHAIASASAPDHVARLSELVAAQRPGDTVKYFLKSMVGVPAPVVAVMSLLPMWSKLKAMAPTLPYDAELTRAGALTQQQLAAVQVPTLVLWGGKSPDSLKSAAKEVSAALPQVTPRELQGLTHDLSAKAVVPVLRDFFV